MSYFSDLDVSGVPGPQGLGHGLWVGSGTPPANLLRDDGAAYRTHETVFRVSDGQAFKKSAAGVWLDQGYSIRPASTYQVAVEGGYEGTEEEFLADLANITVLADAIDTLHAVEAAVDADRVAVITAKGQIDTTAGVVATNAAQAAADRVATGQDRAAVASDKSDVGQFLTAAEQAADRAETASDEAAAAGGIYANTAAGIAGTTNGEYFLVATLDGDAVFYQRYENVAGVAQTRNQSPSKSFVETAAAKADAAKAVTDRLSTGIDVTEADAPFVDEQGNVYAYVELILSRIFAGILENGDRVFAGNVMRATQVPGSALSIVDSKLREMVGILAEGVRIAGLQFSAATRPNAGLTIEDIERRIIAQILADGSTQIGDLVIRTTTSPGDGLLITDLFGRILIRFRSDGTVQVPLLEGGGQTPVDTTDLARVSNNDLIIAGDSMTKASVEDDWPSDSSTTFSHGLLYWLQIFTGSRFNFVPNNAFGVGGYQVWDVQQQLPDILAHPARKVLLIIGANSWKVSTPEHSPDIPTIQAQFEDIIQELLDAGKTVILSNSPPAGDANVSTWTLTQEKFGWAGYFRRWMSAQVRRGNVYFADSWPDMIEPASQFGIAKPNLLRDGLHQSSLGAFVWAKPIARILNFLLPPLDFLPSNNFDRYHVTYNIRGNRLTNAMVLGSGGSKGAGTGALADDWQANDVAGWTITYSKVTDVDGRVWQRVQGSGAPSSSSGSGRTLRVRIPLDMSGLSAGQFVDSMVDLKVAAGTTGVQYIRTEFTSEYPTLDPGSSGSGLQIFTNCLVPSDAFGGAIHDIPQKLKAESPTAGWFGIAVAGLQGVSATFDLQFRAAAVAARVPA